MKTQREREKDRQRERDFREDEERNEKKGVRIEEDKITG